MPHPIFVVFLTGCLQFGCLHSCECFAMGSTKAFVLRAMPDALAPRARPFARETLAVVSRRALVLDDDLFAPEKVHIMSRFSSYLM